MVGERLDICASCHEPFVVPEEIMGLHDRRLVVGLRCESCGVRRLAVCSAARFEELVARHDDGRGAMLHALRRQEIDRFAQALHAGQILPEDF